MKNSPQMSFMDKNGDGGVRMGRLTMKMMMPKMVRIL
uniref:Uncharacterized protein n=1 Tax=Arundo donax TaxID=35708 RepID=A0A0A9DFC4_ARUDO